MGKTLAVRVDFHTYRPTRTANAANNYTAAQVLRPSSKPTNDLWASLRCRRKLRSQPACERYRYTGMQRSDSKLKHK